MKEKINKICPKCGGDLSISYDNFTYKVSSVCVDCGYRYLQKPLDWVGVTEDDQ